MKHTYAFENVLDIPPHIVSDANFVPALHKVDPDKLAILIRPIKKSNSEEDDILET